MCHESITKTWLMNLNTKTILFLGATNFATFHSIICFYQRLHSIIIFVDWNVFLNMLTFLKYISTKLIHHSFSLTNTSNIFIYKAYTSYSKYIVITFLLKIYYRCDFENLYYEKKIILKIYYKKGVATVYNSLYFYPTINYYNYK